MPVKLFTVLLLAALTAPLAAAGTIAVKPNESIQAAIDVAKTSDTILLAAGNYQITPVSFTDPLCGNCQNPLDGATTTVGLRLIGKRLCLIGAGAEATIIATNAGYGVYVDSSDGSELHQLTITGGKRSADGNATDAGIVVRRGRLLVSNVMVRDNPRTDTSVVVGIGGIFGREGAELTIANCTLRNNSWDGIALYRGAMATITDCVIAGGRGAAIGVTWDAICTVVRTDMSGYWKGLGGFGTATIVARNNVIHDNLGWGLIASDRSLLDGSNNLVRKNGNCGIAIWGELASGRLVNNISCENGWRKEWVCPCVGLLNMGNAEHWVIKSNLLWGNAAGDVQGIDSLFVMDGNLSANPLFLGDSTILVHPTSPIWQAGDTTIRNRDGSRSHIGPLGGPRSRP